MISVKGAVMTIKRRRRLMPAVQSPFRSRYSSSVECIH